MIKSESGLGVRGKDSCTRLPRARGRPGPARASVHCHLTDSERMPPQGRRRIQVPAGRVGLSGARRKPGAGTSHGPPGVSGGFRPAGPVASRTTVYQSRPGVDAGHALIPGSDRPSLDPCSTRTHLGEEKPGRGDRASLLHTRPGEENGRGGPPGHRQGST